MTFYKWEAQEILEALEDLILSRFKHFLHDKKGGENTHQNEAPLFPLGGFMIKFELTLNYHCYM